MMRYTDQDLGFDFDGEFASDLIDTDSNSFEGFGCFTEGNVLESRLIISGDYFSSPRLQVLNFSNINVLEKKPNGSFFFFFLRMPNGIFRPSVSFFAKSKIK